MRVVFTQEVRADDVKALREKGYTSIAEGDLAKETVLDEDGVFDIDLATHRLGQIAGRVVASPLPERGYTLEYGMIVAGRVDLADSIWTGRALFRDGPAPPRDDAADADADGLLAVSSALHALRFVLVGGPPDPPPFPACGARGASDRGGAGYGACP